eukprot:4509506-Pyramimonas_sp.AAC.1
MTQDSLQHSSKRPQDGPQTASNALRALRGLPQEAKTLQKPKGNSCCFAFSCFRLRWALEASR